MQTIIQDIKNKTFKPVYLICGEESFLKKSYKNQLRQALTGNDTMNYHYFEGKDAQVGELMSLADTMPFFQDKRLIIVEDSGFFKSSQEELAAYLPTMPESTCLVFVEQAVDKRNKLYKRVKDLGHVAEMKRQDLPMLAKWAGGILSQSGKKITASHMEQFLDRTGDDMELIRTELEKLISYTGQREVVTLEDILAVTSVRVTNQIFEMVSAIVAGKVRRAMDLYEDLLTLKEPPMRIVFLIARQFNQLLQVKELMSVGLDKQEIATRMKISPFIVGKIISQTRTFDKTQLLACIEACVEVEQAVKTGRLNERLAVEMLIVRGCG